MVEQVTFYIKHVSRELKKKESLWNYFGIRRSPFLVLS
jgi:hypothetical protein